MPGLSSASASHRGHTARHRLTERQYALMGFVRDFIKANGQSPNMKEMSRELNIAFSTLQYNLGVLIRKGYLRRTKHAHRGLHILAMPKQKPAPKSASIALAPRKSGSAKGQVLMSDDFDQPESVEALPTVQETVPEPLPTEEASCAQPHEVHPSTSFMLTRTSLEIYVKLPTDHDGALERLRKVGRFLQEIIHFRETTGQD
jgi:SOS-response transcriptional repressor LexA